MTKILFLIKKIVPRKLFRMIQLWYHLVFMIAEMLKSAGLKIGYTSTVMFSDGKKNCEKQNDLLVRGKVSVYKL